MTPEMVARCEQLFLRGLSTACVARQAGIGDSTLRKALARGAIRRPGPDAAGVPADTGSSKSERSRADAQAALGLGTACTRAEERMAAAVGLAQCATAHCEHCNDVMMGGLLAGLPALCANGPFSGIGKYLRLPKGFYSCLHVLLVQDFMALGRIRRPEGLRHIPPGELGKVVGLDRAPEARTLRAKITRMAEAGDPQAWMRELSKTWMREDPGEAGYRYVDGHVRVYHGDAAPLCLARTALPARHHGALGQ